MVKVSLSFRTRSAKSCVVVVQTFPTIGNCTSTTGPADRSFSISAAGLRKYAWLVKSARIIDPCNTASANGLRCREDSTRPKYVAHHVAGDVGRGEFLAQLVQGPTIIVGDGDDVTHRPTHPWQLPLQHHRLAVADQGGESL